MNTVKKKQSQTEFNKAEKEELLYCNILIDKDNHNLIILIIKYNRIKSLLGLYVPSYPLSKWDGTTS